MIKMHKTVIIAHRGASAYAPENTLPAFEKALELGAEGIELDVQLSKDGQLVIIHDEQVNRTSNGQGYVVDHTLRELKQLDFGKWFGSRFNATRIPTLEEVMELIANRNILLNIELKNSYVNYPGMEEKVLHCVHMHHMEDRVIISSFDHYSLAKIRVLNPTIKTGLLYSSILANPWDYARQMQTQALHPHFYSLIRYPQLVEGCHQHGLAVNPYTIDDEHYMKVLFQLKVDGLITNKPDVAKRVRNY